MWLAPTERMLEADSTESILSIHGAEGAGVKHALPSMTTDTEPWSTTVDVLHNHNPAGVHDIFMRNAANGRKSADFGVAAEATFSMTSTDVSPDKSSVVDS